MNTANDRRWFLQPSFLVAGIVLLIAAVGLNAAESFMRLHFKKKPVDLQRPLEALPIQLGHWHQLVAGEPLDKETQDALGAKEYIFRNYVDARVVGLDEIEKIKAMPPEQRANEVGRIQMAHPQAVIHVGVTFYTGMVDTVAHIPDRCYIADGYEPAGNRKVVAWPTTLVDKSAIDWPAGRDPIEVSFMNFEDQTAMRRVPKSVSYVFHVNGHYEADPMGVRKSLQDLFAEYGYYAKIELMTLLRDHEQSAGVMTDFLAVALPEVEKSLPDWNRYVGGSAE